MTRFTGTCSVQTTGGVSTLPVMSVTSSGPVQTTDVVTQNTSSQPFTGTSLVQHTGPVYQPNGVPFVMSVVKPTGQVTAAHDVTSATNVQFTKPISLSVNKKSQTSFTGYCSFSGPRL